MIKTPQFLSFYGICSHRSRKLFHSSAPSKSLSKNFTAKSTSHWGTFNPSFLMAWNERLLEFIQVNRPETLASPILPVIFNAISGQTHLHQLSGINMAIMVNVHSFQQNFFGRKGSEELQLCEGTTKQTNYKLEINRASILWSGFFVIFRREFPLPSSERWPSLFTSNSATILGCLMRTSRMSAFGTSFTAGEGAVWIWKRWENVKFTDEA